VGLSGSASADALWAALRLVALEAFTLVFCNIATGAFRPLLNRVFKGRGLQSYHTVTGATGFGLAVAHGIMVLIFGTSGYRVAPLWVGPAVLAVLAAVIATALARRRLRSAWRWIHRLNYLVFTAILVHGTMLGSDLATQPLLRICFWVYAAVVVAGFSYRMALLLKTSRRAA
jgi:DMSO/TMAO reductase YedYZ heme-binding membrane subunit